MRKISDENYKKLLLENLSFALNGKIEKTCNITDKDVENHKKSLSMATKYIALIEESGRCVDDYYTEKELIAFYQQFKFAKKVIAELKDKYNEIVELPEEYTFWENL